MLRRRSLSALLAGSFALLAGCAMAPGEQFAAQEGIVARDEASAAPAPTRRGGSAGAARDATSEDAASLAPADRLMIRTAELGLEVADVDAAIDACSGMLAELDGYVSRRDGAMLVCRVPAASFEGFVGRIRTLGRVLRETMQVVDVTDQHRDLAIRLDNAKHARDRLLALLERTSKVEDLLKIEAELRRLTEEIERMTASLKSLDDRVALSTVTISFEAQRLPEPLPVAHRPSRFGWIHAIGAEHVLREF